MLQADVVEPGQRTVFLGAIDGDLELARQEGEFRVEGAPLAQDLAQRARVENLVGSDAGKLVGGDVADAVARSLDGMHLDLGQFGQHFRHVLDLRPVELHVVARGEVAVAAVVLAAEFGQAAQLARGEHAVGDGDAEHRRVALDVEAVLQAQRAQFVVGKLAGFPARDLVAELGDAFVDEGLIVVVVAVHGQVSAWGLCKLLFWLRRSSWR